MKGRYSRVRFLNLLMLCCFSILFDGFIHLSCAVDLTTAQQKAVSEGGYASLHYKIQRSGSMRVIVNLNMPHSPLGRLAESDAQAQISAIAKTQSDLHIYLSGHNISHSSNYKFTPQIAMTVDGPALDALLAHPSVATVAEDVLRRYSLAQSVPLIGATVEWNFGFTGAGVTVAILDTGVDKNHPFLSGSVVSEACYSTNYAADSASSVCPGGVTSSTATGSALPYAGSCPAGECDHGTHVAGITAGRYNGSYSGVAKGANIIAIQVFTRFDDPTACGGTAPCAMAYDSDIISGLQRVYALRTTYNIAAVNLSLGGGMYVSYCDTEPEKPSIDNLKSANIATIIASGNDGSKTGISSPACISSAVSVGATDDVTDTVKDFSNSASFLSLLAPGQWITSSVPGGGYATWAGTSMATPHVTGAFALLKQAKPSATVDQVLSALKSTGLGITDTNGITKPRIRTDLAFSVSVRKIIWRNSSTGQNVAWSMNGMTVSGVTALDSVSNAGWLIASTEDFNNDGKPDILWRNTSSGQNVVWLMNGATVSSVAALDSVSDQNWKITGTGDFNGDGKADILWRNTSTGQNAVWLMNGTTVSSVTILDSMADQNWKITGTGDFNGDGKVDILWRNTSTGQNAVWLMNGTTVASVAILDSMADQNWTIAGVSDLNGDGKVDIIWRNTSNGQNAVWLMNGTTVSSVATLDNVSDQNWKIAGIE